MLDFKTQALTRAFIEVKEEVKKNEKWCAVEIHFSCTDYMVAVFGMLSDFGFNFGKSGSIYVDMVDSHEIAQKQVNLINAAIHKANDINLAKPFTSNWLEEYQEVRNYGMRTVKANHEITSWKEWEVYIDGRVDKDATRDHYEARVRSAKFQVPRMSKESYIRGWVEFITANWTVSDSIKGGKDFSLEKMFTLIFDGLVKASEGKSFLSRFPCLEVYDAVTCKAELLEDESGKSVSLYRKRKREQDSVECYFDAQGDSTEDLKDIYIDALEQFDGDLKVRNGKYISTTHVPFNGLDLFYNMPSSPDGLLTPDGIKEYNSRIGGNSTVKALCGMFIVSFAEYAKVKQEQAFERGLIEASKVMDVKPLHGELVSILKKALAL